MAQANRTQTPAPTGKAYMLALQQQAQQAQQQQAQQQRAQQHAQRNANWLAQSNARKAYIADLQAWVAAPAGPMPTQPLTKAQQAAQIPAGTLRAVQGTPKTPRGVNWAAAMANQVCAFVGNPKKPGTAAHARYANYCQATTVGQAVALGMLQVDFMHDTKRNYCQLA